MYNFDEIIDRKNSNAMSTDGFRDYIFHADENMKFPYADDEFIRMWVADMEFAVPDVVIEGIKERLDRRILGYTKVFSPDYYEAFVRWCRARYGWSFPKEELVTSNGVVPALYDLVELLCSPKDKVLILTPSYAFFKHAAAFHGRECVCSDLINKGGDWTIDFADLERKASDPWVKLLIFCNPHNPTGRVWREEELKEIARIVEKNRLWVISDEIHCDLLRCDQIHTPLGKVMADYNQLVTCMAPSKTFNLAGMMISNILIRDESLRKLWVRRHFNCDNPLSIAAAQAAYEKGGPWLAELRKYLDENFAFTERYLRENLPKARFKTPEATYLAWVDLGEYFSPEENLSEFFAWNAGVLLEGGSMFVQNGEGFIRLNLACPRSILEEGLRRICESIARRQAK
ncbi:MAG: putative C-S lyase [Clostridiales bacterium]|nr:putative C-S lyase [Clostridiales bacterium]